MLNNVFKQSQYYSNRKHIFNMWRACFQKALNPFFIQIELYIDATFYPYTYICNYTYIPTMYT